MIAKSLMKYSLLPVLALAVLLLGLSVLTCITIISSWTPISCEADNSIQVQKLHCTIANEAFKHTSYFQSLHGMLLQYIAFVCLLIIRPALCRIVWKRLESKELPTIKELESGIRLSNGPGPTNSIDFIFESRAKIGQSLSLHIPAFFAFFLVILSIVTQLIVSPIYRRQFGPYTTHFSFTLGGGPPVLYPPNYDPDLAISGGVERGRAILSTYTIDQSNWLPRTYDLNVVPILIDSQIQQIWEATVQVAIVRSDLSCDQSAVGRVANLLGGSSVSIANADTFWDRSGSNGSVTIGNTTSFGILHEPVIWTTYIATTNTSAAGSLRTETTVVFFALNGTLEGAQQHLSPRSGPFTQGMDVLFCTSVATIEASECQIYQGNVTACNALPPSQVDLSNSPSRTGLENYISDAASQGVILSGSPAVALYNRNGTLPGYDTSADSSDTDEIVMLTPLSFLTENANAPSYKHSQAYIKQAVFAKSRYALIQGISAMSSSVGTQLVDLTAEYATSQPEWQFILLALAFAIAVISCYLGKIWVKPERRPAPLNLPRILAISRGGNVDHVFQEYTDPQTPLSPHLWDVEFGYRDVRGRGHQVLVSPRTEKFWGDTQALNHMSLQQDFDPYIEESEISSVHPAVLEKVRLR